MIRAFAVHKFPFLVEAFAAKAVNALILTEVDITGLIDPGQQSFNYLDVIRIRGADKVVVTDIQRRPQTLKKMAYLIGIVFRAFVLFFRSLNNFISMFIGAGQKVGFISAHSAVTGSHINGNSSVSMSQMGFGVYIIYGSSVKDISVVIHK